jgi:hypothetical protein
MPYLLKTEPDKYSYDDLLRDGETVWDGIKNPQALITLRNMKRGEECIIYHSNVGKAAVGTAKVVSVTTDPSDPRTPIVRLKAGKRLKREKPLAEIRWCRFRTSSSIGWCTVDRFFPPPEWFQTAILSVG